MNKEGRAALEEIKTHLPEYLEEHGYISSSGKYNVHCIHADRHNNGDKRPSAGFPAGQTKLVHCFGCGSNYDIFTAAHVIEGKPADGVGFWQITVPYLAKKYGVEFKEEFVTPEDIDKYIRSRLYKDIENYIRYNTPKDIINYIEERGWDVDFCKIHGIGGIKSIKDLVSYLRSRGWDNSTLQSYEVASENGDNKIKVLVPERIIFTTYDGYGNPIAFAGRHMKYVKGVSPFPKWINNSTNPLFHKSKTFYGWHVAKKSKDDSLYIVEGQGSWLRMQMIGVENCVAIAGNSLSSSHIEMIIKEGFKRIFILLDSDNGGMNLGITQCMKVLEGNVDLKAYVLELPEKEDPDSYFLDKTIEDLELLNHETSLHIYYAREIFDKENNIDGLIKIARYISVYNSSIYRSWMITDISKEFNLNESALIEEVSNIVKEKQEKRCADIELVQENLLKTLRSKDIDLATVLSEASFKLKQIGVESVETFDPEKVSKSHMDRIKRKYETDESNAKIVVIDKFNGINKFFPANGLLIEPSIFMLPGSSGSGKSLAIRQIALSFLEQEVAVIYLSLDEGVQYTVNCMKSTLSRVPAGFLKANLFMKQIEVNNKYGLDYQDVYQELDKRVRQSQIAIDNWVADKLLYAGDEETDTIQKITMAIEYIKRYHENVALFIDSFQQIKTNTNSTEELEMVAKSIRKLSNRYNMPVFMTSEVVKLGSDGKPKNSDMKGTVKLEHLGDVICLTFNDYKNNKEKSKLIRDIDDDDEIMQLYGDDFIRSVTNFKRRSFMLEYEISKNRLDGDMGKFYMQVVPWSLEMFEAKPPVDSVPVSKRRARIND